MQFIDMFVLKNYSCKGTMKKSDTEIFSHSQYEKCFIFFVQNLFDLKQNMKIHSITVFLFDIVYFRCIFYKTVRKIYLEVLDLRTNVVLPCRLFLVAAYKEQFFF